MIRLLLAAALWLCLALAAPAQEVEAPDYDAWAELSQEVQTALESDVEVDQLEELRERLAQERAEFLEAQETNAARIETVQGQLNSLGPPPAEGEPPESEQIADRRSDLNEQLEELRAPVRLAEQAYTEADSLISAIDRQIRDRYAQRIVARDASPLNPIYWPGAMSALVDTGLTVLEEARAGWNDATDRQHVLQSLPAAVALLILGLLLLFRSTWWLHLFQVWVLGLTRRGKGVLGFVLSLGQVILPLAGVALIAVAARVSELAGPILTEAADALFFVVVPLVVGFWLSRVLFPADRPGPLNLEDDLCDRLRRYGLAVSSATALIVAIKVMGDLTDRDDIAIAVLLYVPRLLLCFLLFRIGRLLTRARWPSEEGDGEERSLTGSFTRLLGRLLMLVAVAAALLATAGYANATEFLLVPAVETLALTGLVLILQRLVNDLYALMTDTAEGSSDALLPVLLGFALTLSAMPVYALIWGARVSDLTEIWSRFQAGWSFGETRISPVDFLTFLVVFVVGYALTRFIQATLRSSVLPKTRLDIGGRNAIASGLGYVGIFTAAVVAVGAAGIDLSNLALVAGALSVGIGFGLQNVVSNFVAGIILLIERPISQGDWIQVNNEMGYVRDISVRSTRIETFDKTDVIVPNADLVSGTVTNWTRGNNVGRVIVPVGVAHGSDTREVERILMEIAREHPMVTLNPEPFIYFAGIGQNSLNFEIRAILRDINFVLNVQTDMNHEIVRRFAEARIEIPFTQQDIWLRNPETMRGKEAREPHPTRRFRTQDQAPQRGSGEAGDGDGDGDGDGR